MLDITSFLDPDPVFIPANAVIKAIDELKNT